MRQRPHCSQGSDWFTISKLRAAICEQHWSSLVLSSPCLLNESLTSEYERPPSWHYIKFCSSTKETAYLFLYPISVEMQVVLTPYRYYPEQWPVAKQYESGKLTIRLIAEHCGALHWLATGIQVYGTLPHSDLQGSIILPHSMPSLTIVWELRWNAGHTTT